MKALETADGLATNLYDTYIKGRTWEQELNEMDQYEKLTKEIVSNFAYEFFRENYVIVYKEKGSMKG
jgi:predicted Zn-dependent peptidase